MNDSLEYISWALPNTLIPLINSKLNSAFVPVLDFTVPETNSVKQSVPSGGDVNLEGIKKRSCEKKSFDLQNIAQPSAAAKNEKLKDGIEETAVLNLTIKELWQQYEQIFRLLRSHASARDCGERFFDWLDEAVQKNKFETRMYLTLRTQIENKIREKLEWANRKYMVPRYRVAINNPLVMISSEELSSNIPQQPAIVDKIMIASNASTRVPGYDFVTIFENATKYSESLTKNRSRAKIAEEEMLSDDNSQSRMVKGHHKSCKRQADFTPSSKAKKKSKMTRDRGSSSGDSLSSTQRGTKFSRDIQTISSSTSSSTSTGLQRNGNKNRAVSSRKGFKKRTKRKKNRKSGLDDTESGDSMSESDDEEKLDEDDEDPPVVIKKNWDEHYTKKELIRLRQYALQNYNFQLKIREKADITVQDTIFDNGPNLSAPVIMQLIAEYLRRKRWRLVDLFCCADKDKTWRLNHSKITSMCRTFGFHGATGVAVTDFIVAFVEETEATLRYRDIRRGMLEWSRERRIRWRYCRDLEVKSLELPERSDMQNEEEKLLVDGRLTLDQVDEEEHEKNLIRLHLAMENRQPIMPPDEIATEVCDEIGAACKWHPVFPQSMILGWRIQQRLRFLAKTGRWLGLQNILSLFGEQRKLTESATKLITRTASKEAHLREYARSASPNLAPQVQSAVFPGLSSSMLLPDPVSSKRTLEELAKGAPPLEILTHPDMFNRYSLNKVIKQMPEKNQEYMESNSDEHMNELRQLRTWGKLITSHSQSNEDDYLTQLTKKQSVQLMENLDDRSDLEKLLRKQFRQLYNLNKVDPLPNDVLETLQIRAARLLERFAKTKEERRAAALDFDRRNDSIRDLVAEFAEIIKQVQSEVRSLYSRKAPASKRSPQAETENLLEQFFPCATQQELMCKELMKNKLLNEMHGLRFGTVSPIDSRTKAVLIHTKRMKSVLDLDDEDQRHCFKKTSSEALGKPTRRKRFTEKLNALHFHHTISPEKDETGKVKQPEYQYQAFLSKRKKVSKLRTVSMECFSHENFNDQLTEAEIGVPPTQCFDRDIEIAISKTPSTYLRDSSEENLHLTMEQLLFGRNPLTEKMMIQLNYLLDAFLQEERHHLVRGLTKEINFQVRKMPISRYQSVEFLERRVIKQQWLLSAKNDYTTSIRQQMLTDYRQLRKNFSQSSASDSFCDDTLRNALLRAEDKNYQITSLCDALEKFDLGSGQYFPTGKVSNRMHKKWFKRFRSLPQFLALSNEPQLMKSIRTQQDYSI